MKRYLLSLGFLFLITTLFSQRHIRDDLIVYGHIEILGDTRYTDTDSSEAGYFVFDSIAASVIHVRDSMQLPDGTWLTGALALTDYSGATILRNWYVGQAVTGTVEDMFSWQLFSAPTITCGFSPTTTLYEVGTSTLVTIYGATNNPGSATLLIGSLDEIIYSTNIDTWTTETNYSSNITFRPLQSPVNNYEQHFYTFRATHTWEKGIENGTATASRSLRAIYPFHYGVTSDDLRTASGTTIYLHANMSKVLQTQGTKTLTLTGTGYPYIIVPAGWSDLSKVTDETGAEVTGWTKSTPTVSSSGLSGTNYINENYECWRGATQGSFTGQNYQFTF